MAKLARAAAHKDIYAVRRRGDDRRLVHRVPAEVAPVAPVRSVESSVQDIACIPARDDVDAAGTG
jgi:hypothetical protein